MKDKAVVVSIDAREAATVLFDGVFTEIGRAASPVKSKDNVTERRFTLGSWPATGVTIFSANCADTSVFRQWSFLFVGHLYLLV